MRLVSKNTENNFYWNLVYLIKVQTNQQSFTLKFLRLNFIQLQSLAVDFMLNLFCLIT